MLVVGGFARIVGNVVALALKLLDRGAQLRHRGADVRQLDDVRLGLLGKRPQFTQRVRDPLVVAEPVGELGEDSSGQRDVAQLELDSSGAGECPDDRH